MKILKKEDAVSHVFGILLIAAMIIILVAIAVMFIFGVGNPELRGPSASIVVMNVPETPTIIDMMIKHAGGDTIKAGDWRLSIVKLGNPPVFRVGSSDFCVGDQIKSTILTDGTGNYIITNKTVSTTGSADALEAGVKYNVQISIYPFKTLTVDAVVFLR